jgi:hypothetical protein
MYYYYYFGGESSFSLKLKMTISNNSSEPIVWKDLNEFTSVLIDLHRYLILVTQEQYEMDNNERDLGQEIFIWHELSIKDVKRENPLIYDLVVSHLTDLKSYILLARYLFKICVKYNKNSVDLKSNVIKVQQELESFMKEIGFSQEKIDSGEIYTKLKSVTKKLFSDKKFISTYNHFCKLSFMIKELIYSDDSNSNDIDLLN